MHKVILITNIPTPYRLPLFKVLHEEFRTRGIDFKVIFGALGYSRRKWQIDMKDCTLSYEVLPTVRFRFADPEKSSFTYSGLLNVLRRERPGIVVTNGFSVATTKLWLLSFIRRTHYIIWSGAINPGRATDGLFRRLHRKLLVKRATGFVAYGTGARDYLVALGAPTDRIQIGINTVDTAYFGRERDASEEIRQADSNRKRVLFIGDLTPRKGADRLLKVVQLLAHRRQDFILDLVGSGDQRPELEQMTKELGITNYVVFHGYKQKRELSQYLNRATCFVFPTRHDIWGLVLVEAMAAGLPCVASIDAGATWDLIREGETGCAADFADLDFVTDKLNWVLDHPDESRMMGRKARRFIEQEITLKKSAEGFVAAIEKALSQ